MIPAGMGTQKKPRERSELIESRDYHRKNIVNNAFNVGKEVPKDWMEKGSWYMLNLMDMISSKLLVTKGFVL